MSSGGGMLYLTPAGIKALASPPAQTIRGIWKKWQTNTIFEELSRVNNIRGQSGQGKRHLSKPSSRRAKIGETMADALVGEWVSIDDFESYMLATDRGFEVTSFAWSLYVVDAQYGLLGESSHVIDRCYLMCLIFEYMATLGMVDVCSFASG